MKTKKSKMMTKLYGEKYSDAVFNRLEYLDPEFNRLVQEVAYDKFWSKNGISIREKSLATISALIAMGKEEQTKIHMKGFLNSGGTVNEIKSLLIHLIVYCGFPAVMSSFAILKEVKNDAANTAGV